MYEKREDGKLVAYKPEPMSGYTNFTAGEWYVSDNELYDPNRAVVEETVAQPRRTLFAQIGDWIAGLFGLSGTAETTSELSASGRAIAGDLPLSPVPETATPSEPPAPRSSQTPPVPSAPQSNPPPAAAEAAPTNTEETPPAPPVTPPPPIPPAPLQNEPVLSSAPTSTEPTPLPEPTLLDLIIEPIVNLFVPVQRRVDSTPPDPPSIGVPSIVGTYRTNINPLVVRGANDNETDTLVIRVGSGEQVISAYPWNGHWSATVNLSEGTNNIRVAARDGAGNESAERSYSVILDTTAPAAPTFTAPATSPFVTTEPAVHFEGWKSEDATIVELGFGVATTTLDSFATSTAWSADFTFPLGSNIVTARAQDATGNWSAPVTLPVTVNEVPVAPTVVVNEIAWMGTNASPNDEWIELYNTTGAPISLAGWTLNAVSGTPQVAISGTIPAYGYFLLERTNDDPVANVVADQFFTGALNNPGERFELRNASGALVDVVDASAGWFAGQNQTGNRRSMERIDPDGSGSDPANWETNDAVTKNGTDKNGAAIAGTPKMPNHATTLLSGNISGMLLFKNSPYSLGNATVAGGATLTIPPGVVIKSAAGSLTVNGTLAAVGSSERPIVFTSSNDDDYGGNTNQSTIAPARGDWKWITVNGSPGSIFEHARVRYGGYSWALGSVQPQVQATGGALTIRNATIELGAMGGNGAGMSLNGTSAIIENCVITNNQNGASIVGGIVEITNCTFSGNSGYGLSLTGTPATLIGNTFTGNSGTAIIAVDRVPVLSGNTASGNVINGVTFSGTIANNSTMSANLTWQLNGLTIGSGATLTMEAGVVAKLYRKAVTVNGTLVSQGTAAAPVTVTSLYDTTVAPSFYSVSTPAPTGGDWEWIIFGSGSGSSTLQYTNVRYGGYRYISGTADAQVRSDGAPITLDHVTVEKSFSTARGVRLVGANATLRDCVIRESQTGLAIEGGAPTVERCTFANNQYGITASGGATPTLIDLIFTGNTHNTDPSSLWP